MSQPAWYFAIGDQEKGPVSEAQIKLLIGSGNLTRGDLVWREGMDDWIPAGDVPGLFDRSAATATATAPAPAPTDKPKQAKPSEAVSKSKRVFEAAEPPAAKETPAARPARRELVPSFDILDISRTFGQPLLILGLLIVLFSRGCDSLADRYAERIVARAEMVEHQFQDEWDAARAQIEARQEAIRQQDTLSTSDERSLEVLADSLRQLDREKQAEWNELRKGKWKALKAAARDAHANNKAWGFWRQMMFVAGTFVFVLGLLSVAHHALGAERWMALVMLAIIVWSIYVAFGAWNS